MHKARRVKDMVNCCVEPLVWFVSANWVFFFNSCPSVASTVRPPRSPARCGSCVIFAPGRTNTPGAFDGVRPRGPDKHVCRAARCIIRESCIVWTRKPRRSPSETTSPSFGFTFSSSTTITQLFRMWLNGFGKSLKHQMCVGSPGSAALCWAKWRTRNAALFCFWVATQC